jgi:hypothetical protein
MTAWTDFVTKIFKNKRKTDKNYQFRDALKEASGKYKKGGVGEPEVTPEVNRKAQEVAGSNG